MTGWGEHIGRKSAEDKALLDIAQEDFRKTDIVYLSSFPLSVRMLNVSAGELISL